MHDDYDLPNDWTTKDLVDWMNGRLAMSRVKSVEFFLSKGELWARVHYK